MRGQEHNAKPRQPSAAEVVARELSVSRDLDRLVTEIPIPPDPNVIQLSTGAHPIYVHMGDPEHVVRSTPFTYHGQ